jgi:hypothetical protein
MFDDCPGRPHLFDARYGPSDETQNMDDETFLCLGQRVVGEANTPRRILDHDPRRSYSDKEMADLAREDAPWWEEIREVGKRYGFNFETLTLNGNALDVKQDPGPQMPVSDFGARVLGFLEAAGMTYKERNAVYQDNFRIVGRVMESLFPSGAPALHDMHDYNRWHIFELIIVKLTRYVANWGNPDRDSLVDMLPYIGILAAQDDEMRDREERRIKDAVAEEVLAQRLRDAARGAGLYMSEPVHSEELRRVRESRRKAREDATAPNYEADADDDDLIPES